MNTVGQKRSESSAPTDAHRHSRTRCYRASRWLLLGGWVLMMPPVPLGTALPPLSQWSQVSAHKTAGECDAAREAMRKSARRTVTNDPNASALKVAGALGQLQARCVQRDLPSDTTVPAAPNPAAPAATPAPAPTKP